MGVPLKHIPNVTPFETGCNQINQSVLSISLGLVYIVAGMISIVSALLNILGLGPVYYVYKAIRRFSHSLNDNNT